MDWLMSESEGVHVVMGGVHFGCSTTSWLLGLTFPISPPKEDLIDHAGIKPHWQYCWQDHGRKHYKLRSHHMKTLVKYVDQGGVIETHDDVPNSLREQLYAEENQRLERRKKSPDNFAIGSICPMININVLPAQSQVSMPTPAGNDVTLSTPSHIDSIVIPGLLDIAVNNYTIWHQSRVNSEAFKENIQKARDVALESCLDLKQIFEDQDLEFFVKQGVKVGVARRFVYDISHWVKRHGDESDRKS